MKRKGAEGVAASPPDTPAANEEFTRMVDALDDMSYENERAGWDPYEVWRTRVKATSQGKQEREHEPLR
jgi:hypothetical protein